MSNYPDDFSGTPYDADICKSCGRREYINENGVCSECELPTKNYVTHWCGNIQLL